MGPSAPTGREPAVRAPSAERRGLNLRISKLPYLVGPVAFVVIVVLMRFGYVAHVRWWVWLIVLVGVTVINVVIDRIYQARRTRLTLNLRVICQVAAVTLVINLTGWGPVLWAAYIFIALENMARAGSRVWRAMVFWSLIGMVIGQICLNQGWLHVGVEQAGGGLFDRDGRLRPLFRHPHGRRHHGTERDGAGAEGGGRGPSPFERGPVPLADPELVRRHDDPR